jgi:DNA-binding CsgD family transcriptional regulator
MPSARPRHAIDAALPAVVRSAFAEADYDRTLDMLSLVVPSSGVELLRARALVRMADYAAAERVLKGRFDASDQPIADALLVLCERASGKGHKKSFAGVLDAASAIGADVEAEVRYCAALAAWQDWDLRAAGDLLSSAPDTSNTTVRGMLEQLRGWIEVRKERYAAATEHFFASLIILRGAEIEDISGTSRAIHGLAVIASETIDLELWQRLRPYVDATRWTAGVRRQHFLTLTCARFAALLRGDLDEAWQRSNECVDLAPNARFAVIAQTNAGVVSSLVGDAFAARRHFDEAVRLIETESWKGADEEERIGLTNFAIEAASRYPSVARTSVTIYQSLTPKDDKGLALRHDRRLAAFEAMAAGRVCEAMADEAGAIIHYERSLRLWSALDYRMRAALVAKDLVRLGGERDFENDVALALLRAPDAWFGASERKGVEADFGAIERLSAAERNVLREILKGKSSREAAEALGRSPFTVNNHTRRIFDVFGVRSRGALIAEAAKIGLTPDRMA